MATKKPKTTAKSTSKAKTTKPKTAAKTVVKPVSEAPKTASKSCFAGFFAKKYEEKESILTIFKNYKFYGALFGEFIGTALLTLLLFSLALIGVHNIATYAFALVAIFVAIYAFSGACLNPLVVAGLVSTRRMSVIRGFMYIIAEIVGAWLGWLIYNSFHLAGGETAYSMPEMAPVADGQFWAFAMVELLGGVIISFFVARALKYKKSAFTYGATIGGGIILAIIVGYIVSAAFLNASSNFAFNPAVALMLNIFPQAGENFGEVMGGIGQALAIYAVFPMVGSVIGAYIGEFASKLSGEE
ncbi:aquaporin [Candidatus Saccharibacteria bacterium]|nr:aquaporin [Candidatus Saccharibacteria bacterium]